MKILVVDDDPGVRQTVSIALERAEFAVLSAADGQQAVTNALRDHPDLIVLDVGLPELDGFEVCRRIRKHSEVPILFLTAQDDEIDRVLGLELGADDYVTKPFSPRELVARIRAILKRSRPSPAGVLLWGGIELDPAAHRCRVSGQELGLTATEMALLAELMRAQGQVVRRTQAIAAIWGAHSQVSDRTLDSHLRNLRRKLAEAGAPEAIESLHGVGMRMQQCHA